MQAITLISPKTLTITEVETPRPDGRQVIIRVTACGICGSDLHYWELGVGMDGLPGLVLGHEFCGIVHDPGNRQDLALGDRVTALPINPCGNCENCRSARENICLNGLKRPNPGNNSPGAYAEYIAVRPDMVRKLPDAVSVREGALIEPAAVALHAVNQANIRIGDFVLITGGGPIGLLCAKWARLAGAGLIVMTEPDPFRISFAEKTGVLDAVIDSTDPGAAKALKQATRSRLNVAIETSATEAGIQTAVTTLKTHGRLVLAGISFSPQPIGTLSLTMKELRVQAAFAYVPREFDWVIETLANNRMDIAALVTREVSLIDVPQAVESLALKTGEDIKVLIRQG